MKRGRKAEPIEVKQSRGTVRKDRDGDKITIVAPDDAPVIPDYLTPEAEEVWLEDSPRVMTAGVVELDSSEFAAYCALEASCRQAFASGGVPPVTAIAELRKKRELFGIAGPKSRVGRLPEKPKDVGNPFVRGKK